MVLGVVDNGKIKSEANLKSKTNSLTAE